MAHHPRSAGTRTHRHLQPLLLRGSADRAGAPRITPEREAPGCTAGRPGHLARPLSLDREFREAPASQRNPHPQVLPAPLEGRAAPRFLQRIDELEKNWKFSLADIAERGFWKQYMQVYEECLGATSTRDAPWYVVPADDKDNARLMVSRIILDTLAGLKMTYPKTSAKRRQELQEIRKRLAK